MSVSGLCQICEARPAMEQCTTCGSFVCDRHFARAQGRCVECVRNADGGRTL